MFKKCEAQEKRFILICLSLHPEEFSGSHANNILFDMKNSVVIRIEPHGFDNETFYNQQK